MNARKLSRRNFLRVTAFGSMGAFMAACAAPAAPPAPAAPAADTASEAAEAPTAAAAPAAAPATVSFMGFPMPVMNSGDPEGLWEQNWSKEYMELHPEVKVEYQLLGWDSITKLTTMLTAGNPPDLLLQGGIEYILYALNSGVAAEVELPQEYIDDLPTNWHKNGLYQGKGYFIPMFVACSDCVMVNLDIVEEAGADDLLPKYMPADNASWTFDQYTELMRKCTYKKDDGTQVWGSVIPAQVSNPFLHHPEQVLSWNWGTDTVAYEDGTWQCVLDDEAGIAWLQWLQDLAFKDQIIPDPSGMTADRMEYWNQGTCATTFSGNPTIAMQDEMEVDPETLAIKDSKNNLTWRLLPFPLGPTATQPASWGGPKLDTNFMVFKGKDPASLPAATDFALWYTNAENQKRYANTVMPARNSARATVESPTLKWFDVYGFPYGRQRSGADGGRSTEEAEGITQVLQKIFLPGANIEEATASFCSTMMSLDWQWPK